MWDGRADTLQDQALLPLLDPREMDGGTVETVAVKMQRAPYAAQFAQLFGAAVFDAARFAVAEALFAVARYQVEDSSFHPYTSKFDYWLEGRTRLTPREWRGYILFNDPAKANCAGCHVDQPSRDGLPPLLTDHQFEALGAPRNGALAVNRDAGYFDLGICGPLSRRHVVRDPILRHVYDADLAQRRHAPGVLPQRRIPDAATGFGLLRLSRYRTAKDLSASGGRHGKEVR